MEEDVTRSLIEEFAPEREMSVDGDWYAIRIQDLLAAGWERICFHLPTDVETPNFIQLFGTVVD